MSGVVVQRQLVLKLLIVKNNVAIDKSHHSKLYKSIPNPCLRCTEQNTLFATCRARNVKWTSDPITVTATAICAVAASVSTWEVACHNIVQGHNINED